MAGKLFLGANTPGALNVAANFDPAAIISDNDDLVFNSTSDQTDITVGLDSHSGVEIESLHIHPSYTAKMGTSGNPLKLATSASGRIIYQGNGGFFYENKQAIAEVTARMFIDTDNLDDVIEIGGVIDRVIVIKGRVTGVAGWDGSVLNMSWRTDSGRDANFTIESSAALGSIIMNGGTILHTGASTVSTLVLSSGRIIQGTAAGLYAGIFQTGGVIVYKSAGNIAAAQVLGGTLDLSQDGRAKTISTLSVHPGGVFRPNANITIGSTSPTTNGSILPITDTIP